MNQGYHTTLGSETSGKKPIRMVQYGLYGPMVEETTGFLQLLLVPFFGLFKHIVKYLIFVDLIEWCVSRMKNFESVRLYIYMYVYDIYI